MYLKTTNFRNNYNKSYQAFQKSITLFFFICTKHFFVEICGKIQLTVHFNKNKQNTATLINDKLSSYFCLDFAGLYVAFLKIKFIICVSFVFIETSLLFNCLFVIFNATNIKY